MEELRLCCGVKPVIVIENFRDTIQCPKCGTRTGAKRFYADAAREWNRMIAIEQLKKESKMTLEKKLEIVSKNYADKYVEDVNVKSMVHKAYCEGFKAGYKKATTQCQPQSDTDERPSHCPLKEVKEFL